MSEPEYLPTLNRDELLALVAELQRQIAALTMCTAAITSVPMKRNTSASGMV